VLGTGVLVPDQTSARDVFCKSRSARGRRLDRWLDAIACGLRLDKLTTNRKHRSACAAPPTGVAHRWRLIPFSDGPGSIPDPICCLDACRRVDFLKPRPAGTHEIGPAINRRMRFLELGRPRDRVKRSHHPPPRKRFESQTLENLQHPFSFKSRNKARPHTPESGRAADSMVEVRPFPFKDRWLPTVIANRGNPITGRFCQGPNSRVLSCETRWETG
jgi:hypothetical protein